MTTTIQTIRFGIEIETIGRSRSVLAAAIAEAIGGVARYEGGGYDKWAVVMTDGRKWTLMSDSSLSTGLSAEIVSPILTYADLDMMQTIVRTARKAGARVDESCGIHVHVDGAAFDVTSLTNLVTIVNKREALIVKALKISANRARFCKEINAAFMARLGTPRTIEELKTAWYGSADEASYATGQHYHNSRYVGLNLHSFFFRGTVEFRYFNGSLHAGEVKAYVQFCLALAARALTPGVRRTRPQVSSDKKMMGVFLTGLGLVGEEFKTARLHLSKAWSTRRVGSDVAA